MFAARLATVGLCAALLFAPTAGARRRRPRSADPIGDFADGVFLRSRDGAIVLFPGGRLQIDGAFFRQQTPKSGAFVRRARVELRGWLGPLSTSTSRATSRPRPPPAPTSRRAPSPPPTSTWRSRRSATG